MDKFLPYGAAGISVSILSAIFIFSENLMGPFVAPYAATFFKNDILLSLLFSAIPLTIFLTSFFITGISDVIGRIKIIRIGVILQIFAVLIYLSQQSFLFFFVARVLDALAFSAVALVGFAKVEDMVKGKRGAITGFHESLISFGRILGPLVGGFFADRYFLLAPFVVSLSVLFILLFCLYFFKDDKPQARKKEGIKIFSKQFKIFFAHKDLRAVSFLGILVFFAAPATSVFLPLFILNELKGTYWSIGIIFLMLQFMHLFAKQFGVLADRYSPKKLIILGVSIHAFALAFIPLSSKIWILVILALLASWGGAMWNTSVLSFVSEIGESLKREGGMIGTYASIIRIGSFMSYLISGFIVAFWGLGALFLLNGLLQVVGVLFVKRHYFKI